MPKSKSSQQVEVTIHSLKFPQKIDKAFLVTWVRGNSNGATPQAFQNENNEVFYDNKFKFVSTLFLHGDGTSKKAKDIKFKVYLMEDIKKKKEIGSVSFDISTFKDLKTPTMGRYPVKTPFGTATLFVTIIMFPIEGKSTGTDSSAITSDSNLSSSEVFVNNESIFKSLPDSIQSENGLSNYSPKKPRSKVSMDKIADPIMATSNFTSGRMLASGKSISRQTSFGSLRPLKLNVNSSVNKSSLNVNSPMISSFQIFDIQQALNDVTQIFSVVKERSPLDIERVPKIVTALVALLDDLKAFNVLECEDSDFNNILSLIEKKIETESPIIGMTPFDKWYIAMCLICIPKRNFFEAPSRIRSLSKVFKPMACKISDQMCHEFKDMLKPFVKQILNHSNKFESFLNKIERTVSEVKYKTSEMECPEFMTNFVIYEFDVTLVTELIKNPMLCTFGNAVNWNSFITSFSATGLGELNLLRECAAVLMMASSICMSPEESESICPSLPKDFLVRLLANQQPDEMMPLTNDTTAISEFYKVDINVQPKDLLYDQFEAVEFAEPYIPFSEWNKNRFTKEELDALQWLPKHLEN